MKHESLNPGDVVRIVESSRNPWAKGKIGNIVDPPRNALGLINVSVPWLNKRVNIQVDDSEISVPRRKA